MPLLLPPFESGRLNREPITWITAASHPVVLGRIHVPVRTGSVDAYVKLLPLRGFVVESVCAWLVRHLGLPMPDPFWVTVHRQRMSGSWPFGDDEHRLCFGTAALPFAQPVQLDNQSTAVLATKYGLAPLLLAKVALFDELIGNDDRHDGNLLLTPRRAIMLIDHENALGGTGLGLFPSDPPVGVNRLLQKVRTLPPADRIALKSQLLDFCVACERAAWQVPYSELIADDTMRDLVRDFLVRRSERLRDTLGETLGVPDLPGLTQPLHPSIPL